MKSSEREFWESLDELVETSRVVIDRQKGTSHPYYVDMIYPLDYGYLEGTGAIDAGGIDLWVGTHGVGKVQGMLCTVDLVKRDAEMKLYCGCTEQEVEKIRIFLNQHQMAVLLEKRQDGR